MQSSSKNVSKSWLLEEKVTKLEIAKYSLVTHQSSTKL